MDARGKSLWTGRRKTKYKDAVKYKEIQGKVIEEKLQ